MAPGEQASTVDGIPENVRFRAFAGAYALASVNGGVPAQSAFSI